MGEPRVVSTDPNEPPDGLASHIPPGRYRWAVCDRKVKTVFYGAEGIRTHLGVAEQAGILKNPPNYYRPGGNVLGGYVCCSRDGFLYYDPYSGTFPGTNEGVEEAEAILAATCARLGQPFKRFNDIPAATRVARPVQVT